MSELREVTTTCLDIPKSEIDKAFGHLSEKRIYEWASYQTALSAAYIKTGNGTSSTPEGTFAKRAMLDKLKGAFIKRGNPTDWDIYKDLFVQHLEDPGTLENFRYFCVPNSDEMIMFYVSIWMMGPCLYAYKIKQFTLDLCFTVFKLCFNNKKKPVNILLFF